MMLIDIISTQGGDIDNVGKVKGDANPLRVVSPSHCVADKSLIVTPNLILKGYRMYTEEDQPDYLLDMNDATEEFLKQEIAKGRIDPLSGLGFAILSRGFLNVARWDDHCAIVLANNLYQFDVESRKLSEATRVDLNRDEAFCVWELGIVEHERKAWMTYLNSQKRRGDKMNYLSNFIEGARGGR